LIAVTVRSPDYGDAWSALGDMYLWSDRPRDAVNAYGNWVSAAPGATRPYIARARAHRSAGSLDAARADFEAARVQGAPNTEIDQYVASLQPRRMEQEAVAPEGFTWMASLSYDVSKFSTDRSDWHDYSATLRRYWKQGSLGIEYLSARRFDSSDYAAALDAYVDLWQRAYANIRYQYAPHFSLFPHDAYRMEIFQGVGKGWELSGSYDHMDFSASNVDMYGAGLGKYTGNWYFRWKTLYVPSAAGPGTSHRVLARYYYAGNSDDYFEMNGGFGRGGEFLWGTTTVQTTRSRSYGAAFQTYFTPRWGIKITAGYDDNNQLSSYSQQSCSIKSMMRW